MPDKNGNYIARDYLSGLCNLPPSIAAKRQKSYAYAGDLSITNTSSGRLDIGLDADSYFLVEGIEMLSSLQTAAGDVVTVQITDTSYSQPWSNVAVPMRDIAGYGNQVHELRFPNMLAPTGTLSFNITNNGGATQQFYVVVHGRKFYGITPDEMAFLKRRMWFQYAMSVPTIANGVTGTLVNMQLFNESDFLCYQLLSYQAWKYIVGATAGSVSAEIKCNFRDTSADRNFFSQNAALRLVVGTYFTLPITGGSYVPTGTGTSQFRFIRPLFIRRNGLIQGTFDNLSTGSTGAFIVVFEGARLFDPAQ